MIFKNKKLTTKAFQLISISFFSILLAGNVLNTKVYGQQLLQILDPNTNKSSEQMPDVRITSLIPNQQVPVGNLTIFGTSNYNRSSDCAVYVGLNGLSFKKTSAIGMGGINDYSDWNFTFSPLYQQILNGTNMIDSELSCLASPENLTRIYSLNVTGVLNGNLTNQSSSGATIDNSVNSSDLGSFTNSEEYRQGSDAFRACIDAAASVGNKLSDYEIQNCREDPSYRHGLNDQAAFSSASDSNTDPISTSSYDGGSSSDSSAADSSGDGSGSSASTNVCSGGNSNAGGTKTNDGEFNVGAAGDWSGSSIACKTALNMESKGVDLALGLGDYAYSSGSEGVTNWWENVMAPLHGIFKGALGNHDTQDKDAYAHYFGQSGPWFYSFNEHGIHFLALDMYSSFGSGSTQYKFVSDDLAAASVDPAVKWIIVFFHEPMYTSPSHHPPLTSLRETYHTLFDKYGVDLVLQGHNHNYQRTYPISYNQEGSSNPIVTSKETDVYDNPQGQIYMEVGTGGQNSYPLDGKSPFVYKQFTTKGGFLNLAFPNADSIQASFYDNDGTVKDQFTINKAATAQPNDVTPSNDTVNAITFEDTPVVVPVVVSNGSAHTRQPEYTSASLSSSVAPAHGSIVLNGNKTITYVPEHNYFGTDSFGYSILEKTSTYGADKSADSVRVNIKVKPVNDPPVAVDDNVILNKDSILPSIDLLSNDYDPDGDPIKITNIDSTNASSGDAANNGDGTISYIPAKDFVGTTSFVYTISDTHNASAKAIVTIRANESTLGSANFESQNTSASMVNLGNASADIAATNASSKQLVDTLQILSPSNESLKHLKEPKDLSANYSSHGAISSAFNQNHDLGRYAQEILTKAQTQLEKSLNRNSTDFVNETEDRIKTKVDLSKYGDSKNSRLITEGKAAKIASLALSNAQKHEKNSIPQTQENEVIRNFNTSNTKLGEFQKNEKQPTRSVDIKGQSGIDSRIKDITEVQAHNAVTKAEKRLQEKFVVLPVPGQTINGKDTASGGISNQSLEVKQGANIKSKEHKVPLDLVNHKYISQGGPSRQVHANAGPDITVHANINERTDVIRLNGEKSTGSDNGVLNYKWEQIAGPHVELVGSNERISSFGVPSLPPGIDKAVLKFKLTVTAVDVNKERQLYDTDSVKITIKWKDLPNKESGTIGQSVGHGKAELKHPSLDQIINDKKHESTPPTSVNILKQTIDNDNNAVRNNNDTDNNDPITMKTKTIVPVTP